jgi:[ribosomal protein S5]-alanine N-acetyltransferase
VIESGDGELLGRITLSGITRGALQSCAMGYWIRADRLRRGHASRAVRAATDHAFDVLRLHRVQAETLPENVGSQRALQAAGFTRYGLAPEYIEIDGVWRDHVMFQLLRPTPR